jgi:CubicO group peptidase (beta-lactamase class C family)
VTSILRVPAEFDALMSRYEGRVPGAGVLIVHRGEPLLRRAYGYADLEGGVRASGATNYRLASLTKQFIAAATLLLIEEGGLDLGAPLGRWLPELADAARAITIKQLLTHTSGIVDYEDLIPRTRTAQLEDEDVLALLAPGNRGYFPPGTGYRYSNSGYVLLGLALARAGRRPLAELLEERLFAPLGMRATVLHQEGRSLVPERAFGYSQRGAAWERTDQNVTSATLGDGGIYSSIEDLERWIVAIDERRLLTPQSWHLMFTAATPTDQLGTSYGLGWRISGERVWHSGESIGFRNVIVRFPARDLAVVLLTNRNDPPPLATALAIADGLCS